LVTDWIWRVTVLRADRATTQSFPLKLNPVAQEEQMVAERQLAHLAGQDWQDPLRSANFPEPQLLAAETQRFWLRVRPAEQTVQ
jgi:hypothetical protein